LAIQNIIEDHSAMTHSSITPSIKNRNTAGVFYLHNLTNLYPELSFLDFAKNALYWKDFAKNETKETDLWGAEYLGPPEEVPAYFKQHNETMLQKGGAGDGKNNATPLNCFLTAHLSAAVNVIVNGKGSEALSGTLHLKFKEAANSAIQVAVISKDTKKEKILNNFSSEQEVIFSFRPESQVVVIAVDPEWKFPEQDSAEVLFDVWVEPCGGEQTGETINVSTAQEMYAALATASPGDTVKLAPGAYNLWVQEFSFPPAPYGSFKKWSTLVVWDGITLAGSGPDLTTIILPYATPSGHDGSIWLLEGATLKDLYINAQNNRFNMGYIYPVKGAVHRTSFCNVNVQFNQIWPQGLYIQPWYQGGNYLLQLYDTIFTNTPVSAAWDWGIESYTHAANQSVEIEIRNSQISGWKRGLMYWCDEDYCGQTTVDAPCDNFINNDVNMCNWNTDTLCVELCP
jgi:hypothetical protein